MDWEYSESEYDKIKEKKIPINRGNVEKAAEEKPVEKKTKTKTKKLNVNV
jgi:hypothetical protein